MKRWKWPSWILGEMISKRRRAAMARGLHPHLLTLEPCPRSSCAVERTISFL
ncbi:MAG: hypothetical protein ACFFD4_09190 [Candidatus Odinarchaeota archaeon]